MRGAQRLTIAGLGAALLLGPVAALAQEAPQPAANPPADTVGPRELQNFSLQGNVTRPADQPAEQAPAPATTAGIEPAQAPPTTGRQRTRQSAQATAGAAPTQPAPPREIAQVAPAPQPVAPAATTALPTTPAPVPASAPTFAPDTSTGVLAPQQQGFPLLPWILAALMLSAGGVFLFWRSRSRPALAGGPQMDLFTAPEAAPSAAPTPRPAPAPSPRPRAEAPAPLPAAQPLGIVSASLRPWIDINAQPLRCIVTEETVTIEFELDLFNSGSAPARDTFLEAVVINAGATQDEELAAFFARPAGVENPIDVIHALTRTSFTTQVVTPREHITIFEAGGREVFVPLLALNAFYRRGSAHAQTSVSYLLGRETNSGKMAPFRLDQGARIFRGLGTRLLPNGVRR
jgi:hypothetical protein